MWSFLYSPFGIFSLGFAYFFNKLLYEKIKSCNLNTEFCRFRREFSLGPKVLNALVRVFLSNWAMFVVLSFSRKPNAKITSFNYDYMQNAAASTSVQDMLKSAFLCLLYKGK
jgi:hypothetical protein